jgi:hypothetical protein
MAYVLGENSFYELARQLVIIFNISWQHTQIKLQITFRFHHNHYKNYQHRIVLKYIPYRFKDGAMISLGNPVTVYMYIHTHTHAHTHFKQVAWKLMKTGKVIKSSKHESTDEFSPILLLWVGAGYGRGIQATWFRIGNFTWFPDHNTIVFVHGTMIPLCIPHFYCKLYEDNEECCVTNWVGEKHVQSSLSV